jgi:hypothetical protein
LAADLGGEEARAGKDEEDLAGGGFREAFFLGEVAGSVELIRIFRQVQKEAKPDLEAFIDQQSLRIYTPSFRPANFRPAFTRKPFYHKAVFLVICIGLRADGLEGYPILLPEYWYIIRLA